MKLGGDALSVAAVVLGFFATVCALITAGCYGGAWLVESIDRIRDDIDDYGLANTIKKRSRSSVVALIAVRMLFRSIVFETKTLDLVRRKRWVL